MRILNGLVCLAVTALLLAACTQNSGDEGQAASPITGNAEAIPGPPSSGTAVTEPGPESSQDLQEAASGESESEPGHPEMDGTAGQLYAITFEAMMKLDEALNDEMKYIAIDLSEMTQLTEDDKTYIIEYLQSFGTDIRNRTFEQLKEEEKLEENNLVLKGVLLRIEKVEIGEDVALIEGSKFRAGNGAIGAKITLKLEAGAWKLADAEMTWVS